MRAPLDVADPLAQWPAAVRRAFPRLVLGTLLGGIALWLAFRGIDAGELWQALQAVNYFWVGASLVSVVLQVGIAPPSLPGKLGVFHYLIVLALSFFGVGRSPALTYALVLYAVALLSKVLVGGAWLAWLRWLPARRQPLPGVIEAG